MYKLDEIRAKFPMLNNKTMQGKPLVFLDNASTTFKPQCVIDAMQNYSAISEKTVRRAEALDYNKLFDPSVNSMYFPLLKNLIVDNYSFFTNVFEKDTFESVKEHLEAINSGRKCADHGYTDESENWSWTQFEAFRESMSWLERIISDYE